MTRLTSDADLGVSAVHVEVKVPGGVEAGAVVAGVSAEDLLVEGVLGVEGAGGGAVEADEDRLLEAVLGIEADLRELALAVGAALGTWKGQEVKGHLRSG